MNVVGSNNLERKDILKSLLKRIWQCLAPSVPVCVWKEVLSCITVGKRVRKRNVPSSRYDCTNSRREDQTLVSFYEVRCLVSVSLPSALPGRELQAKGLTERTQVGSICSSAWQTTAGPEHGLRMFWVRCALAVMALSQRDPVVTAPFSCPRSIDY